MLSPRRSTRSEAAHFSIVIDARKSAMMGAYGSAGVAGDLVGADGAGCAGGAGGAGAMVRVT
jgi:hypothetical protein